MDGKSRFEEIKLNDGFSVRIHQYDAFGKLPPWYYRFNSSEQFFKAIEVFQEQSKRLHNCTIGNRYPAPKK